MSVLVIFPEIIFGYSEKLRNSGIEKFCISEDYRKSQMIFKPLPVFQKTIKPEIGNIAVQFVMLNLNHSPHNSM